MAENRAFESGDDQRNTSATQVVTKRGSGGNHSSDADDTPRSASAHNAPDEGTFLAGPQTYFADEKIIIPDIDKVSYSHFFFINLKKIHSLLK